MSMIDKPATKSVINPKASVTTFRVFVDNRSPRSVPIMAPATIATTLSKVPKPINYLFFSLKNTVNRADALLSSLSLRISMK
jgi:hypothetical protein